MSDPRRVMLVGATGLVGRCVMQAAIAHPLVQLVALSRREAPLPLGGRLEMLVAGTADWPDAIATIAPDSAICAIGTTWRQAGEDEASFRAVDFDLVMTVALAAKEVGVTNFVLVSSAGADRHAKTFYLRVKGEVEAALSKLRFKRLDVLRPGLLRGPRSSGRRPLERLGIVASPLSNLMLHGAGRAYRAIDAQVVAVAALQCTREKAAGRFVHDNDAIHRAVRRLEGVA
jgi:uncharacterized protein YbjT (DUF2867 family)